MDRVNGKDLKATLDSESIDEILCTTKSEDQIVHDLYTLKLYEDLNASKSELPFDSLMYETEYGLPITHWSSKKPHFGHDNPLGEADILGVEMTEWPKLYVFEVKSNLGAVSENKAYKQLNKAKMLPFDVKGLVVGGDEIMSINSSEVAEWYSDKDLTIPGGCKPSIDNDKQKYYLELLDQGYGLHGRDSFVGNPNCY